MYCYSNYVFDYLKLGLDYILGLAHYCELNFAVPKDLKQIPGLFLGYFLGLRFLEFNRAL